MASIIFLWVSSFSKLKKIQTQENHLNLLPLKEINKKVSCAYADSHRKFEMGRWIITWYMSIFAWRIYSSLCLEKCAYRYSYWWRWFFCCCRELGSLRTFFILGLFQGQICKADFIFLNITGWKKNLNNALYMKGMGECSKELSPISASFFFFEGQLVQIKIRILKVVQRLILSLM